MPICFGGAGRSTGNPLTDFIISPHAGKIKIFCGFLSRTSVSARLGARAPHGRGSRTFFSGENMKYTLHVTTFGRRTARWGSFELKICFRFGVQLQITAAHPRCSAAATRRRGRLPIKCKLSFSGDSFNVPLRNIRSLGAGTARRKVKQNSFLILRRHISYLRSKSHPAESRQITSSLFTVTSYFKKILIKGKRQVKSEEVISKKSSFLRMRIFWRREWDSNPRDVAVKRFSRKLGFVSPRRSYFISDSMAVHSKSFSTPFSSSFSISCSLYCKKLILQ